MKRLAGATAIVLLLLMCLAAPTTKPAIASGQTAADASASTLVAVVVKIPIPQGVNRDQVVAGMVKSIPEYQKLPGLIRKYYTLTDDGKFGGIYLFENRKAAEDHFNDDWRANIVKTRGAPAEVTYFDVPIVIEGPASQGLTVVK
ncbi:MAG: YdhR family protein [Candidatus Acidiferrales bacterium]